MNSKDSQCFFINRCLSFFLKILWLVGLQIIRYILKKKVLQRFFFLNFAVNCNYLIWFLMAIIFIKGFTVGDVELFHEYLFDHIMEMYDLKRRAFDVTDGCPFYHCMPRYVRILPGYFFPLLPILTFTSNFSFFIVYLTNYFKHTWIKFE